MDVGGQEVETVYGAITAATDDFFEAPQGGGILGLAFSDPSISCNTFSCFPSLWDEVVRQRDVPDMFAVSKKEKMKEDGSRFEKERRGQQTTTILTPSSHLTDRPLACTAAIPYLSILSGLRLNCTSRRHHWPKSARGLA